MLSGNKKSSTNNNIPLITIGITCFNAVDTILRAVASAKQQEWSNKEIIIVDDASTDNSLAVIEELSRNDPDIRVIRHDSNKGYPGSLNTILEAANGEFIAFFDDDDESRADRLYLQWKRLTNYEKAHDTDLVFCYSNREVIPAGYDKPTRVTLAIGRHAPEPRGNVVSDFLLSSIEAEPYIWGQFGSCTLMTRRTILKQLGGFDESFRRCAEWDMAIRAGFEGGHFISVNQPLVTQYLTPGVENEKSGKAPLSYALKLRYKHRDYLVQKGIYWSSIAQAHARFHYARGERWTHRLFTALACMLSPRRLFPHILVQYMRVRRNKNIG